MGRRLESRVRLVAALTAFAAPLLPICHGAAAVRINDEWHVSALEQEGERFCMAADGPDTQFPRVNLTSKSDSMPRTLTVTSNNWGPFEPGSEEAIAVNVELNGKPLGTLEADALDTQALVMVIPETLEPQLLRAGKRLKLTTAAGSTQLIMKKDVEGVVASLDRCLTARDEFPSMPPTHLTAPSQAASASGSPRQSLKPTVLTCALTSERVGPHTLTITFDEAARFLESTGGPVANVRFSQAEISFEEPLTSDSTKGYVIERFSGSITGYIGKKTESSWTRMSTGTCEIKKSRLF